MNAGVYIALFRLSRSQVITIGRLGRYTFPGGTYAYVGSAQRNLQARLACHARRHKPLRWRIDYLSTRARFLGALAIKGPQSLECRVAEMLAKHFPHAVPHFGSSDCRCAGHLFRVGDAQ